jgi:anthranilate synthase component 1
MVREITADTCTPVAAFLRLRKGAQKGFLLESVEGGERMARYSFLGTNPSATLESRHGAVVRVAADGSRSKLPGHPFYAIGDYLMRYRAVPEKNLPRFSGGAVGYLAYEMMNRIEPSVRLPGNSTGDAAMMIFPDVVAFDRLRHRMLLIANVVCERGASAGNAYRRACDALDDMAQKLSAPFTERSFLPGPLPSRRASAAPRPTMSRREFCRNVERIKEHIRAGDTFQTVLSERFEAPLHAEPFSIYRALRAVNPSPYMFYIGMSEHIALGASPEMLLRVEDGILETRPIAGTRRRGASDEEDRMLERQLLASPKEKAEHLMLVDLGRNDLGRAARSGSVHVPSFMQVERYSHVMHIVSSVRAKLRPGRNAWDALAACFPAGTVTGAPKIKAMQILSGLEQVPRGLYAGSVVYSDFHGNLDSAIAIRSIEIMREGGIQKAFIQAGAGIVADSRPEREWQEVCNKAKAMTEALRLAEEAA